MNLTESFRTECVRVGLSATGKDGALQEIARCAKSSDVLEACSEDQIYRALKDREDVGSTAFGDGIAIPHCALEGIESFVVGIITEPEGIDFNSCDGKPTRLFVFIIAPASKRNEHVTILSAVSRILDDQGTLTELLAAPTSPALAESFLRHHSGHIPHQDREKCFFHVTVQDEAVFDEILRIFSSSVEGEISVIEAKNAGSHLDRLPMFAAFWHEQSSGFCRIILAVVDKALCNDVVRRINVVTKGLEDRSGVLVTVHELMLARGSLDF